MVEWVGQNRETDEEHEDCVEEGLQLAKVKNEGSREALNMGNCDYI